MASGFTCRYGAVCLGAMLLVAPPVGAMSSARGEPPPQTASQSSPKRADIPADIAISETHIFVLKFMLQLRPEQEGHWLPVEAALRELARSQAAADARHVSTPGSRTRTAEKPEIANRLREIAVLARPLLRSLDVNQRQKLAALARAARLEQLLLAAQ